MILSGESTKVSKFQLIFYETTEEFRCGSSQDAVLSYIKRAKGGRGGSFKMLLKDGSREPFLDDVFIIEGDIIGYEFVPEDLTPRQQGNTPRLLRCVWLLCVLDAETNHLSAVATSFAVECPSKRKIVTAFHNITNNEPKDHEVNNTEPYYIVNRLYPKQGVDRNAIEVKFSDFGDYARDWAVLDVVGSPDFAFSDTLPLRLPSDHLPFTTDQSLFLNTLYYKVGLHHTTTPEFIEATVTGRLRMDHVYSEVVEMPNGLYSGASGAPMVDDEGSVVAIHVESISEIVFSNKRIKISDVVSEVSSSHAHSRYGNIIFNIAALRIAIGIE